MAITLDGALKLFHKTMKELRDPDMGRNPLLCEVNEAIAAGVPETQIVNTLVSQFRDAKERAADRLHDAARHRKAAAEVTALHRERDEYAGG